MTSEPRHDIRDRADLERLVDVFYERAFADPLIGYLFTDVAHLDMEKHRPVITDFWETLLFGTGSYGGGAFAVHRRLHEKAPLFPGHFERWVAIWNVVVRELFEGPVADEAMRHGRRIATAFFRRLQQPAEFDGTPEAAAQMIIPVQVHGGADTR